jgi:hypothetical protein
MGDPAKQAQYHRARAEAFRSHADRAREVSTREMYLRLARTEEALANQSQQQLQLPVISDRVDTSSRSGEK